MGKYQILNDPLPNLPWEDKPVSKNEIVWRYSKNPIIDRNPLPKVQSIYNSAVVPFNGKFVGVFRADSRSVLPYLHFGQSNDGINWKIEADPIFFQIDDPEIGSLEYAYDPRVCKIEGEYYITWCNCYHGPTIGVAQTYDFKTFHQLENAFLPFNRNGVLFPRKIRGKYVMLSRPSDNGHTPFGDIFLSESPDMIHWGKHRFVMGAGGQWWQGTKVGAGPTPIETSEGWLLLYHGVLNTCNGFVYNMGAALLDIDEPHKVLYRTNQYLLTPEEPYETTGKVPNVVFPCAALTDPETGRIAIYYGGADTYTCLAFAYIDDLIDFVKENSEVF
ncbi:MAG: glycosidase [Calditrichaeota bacterium]|nr:glycosidase [Calditrichota bacterium]